jgi:D-sedoheptulose 7-phosphate isomerase
VTGRRDDGPAPAVSAAASPDMESLYPFLYADGAAGERAVRAQVRASTIAKAEEILQLRRVTARQDGARMAECAREMAARFAAGGRLFAFGNGGSATDAAQLVHLFLASARPLPAFGLSSDPSVVTALGNDVGLEVVFARQLGALARPADIAVGLSTSGNSGNLLRAFSEAGRRGLLTVGLAGYDGGKMAEIASLDYLFVVRSDSVHRIQEAQTTIYQVLWELTVRQVAHVPRDTG